jgi:uncharacterized protein (DUF2062 family)
LYIERQNKTSTKIQGMDFRKIQNQIKFYLRKGLNPKELALCLTLTVYISVFPVLGTITVLLTLVILKLNLNLPLALSVSYLLTPLQLLSIIPFVRVGEFVHGAEKYPLTIEQLQASIAGGFTEMIAVFSSRIMMAISGWALIATPICLILYIVLYQTARWRQLSKIKEEVESYKD